MFITSQRNIINHDIEIYLWPLGISVRDTVGKRILEDRRSGSNL